MNISAGDYSADARVLLAAQHRHRENHPKITRTPDNNLRRYESGKADMKMKNLVIGISVNR